MPGKGRKRRWCNFAQRVPVQGFSKESSLYQRSKNPLTWSQKVHVNEEREDGSSRRKRKNVKRIVSEHIFRFSYVVFRKGESVRLRDDHRRFHAQLRGVSRAHRIADPAKASPVELAHNWSRLLSAPRKRGGHVFLDLCTPDEGIERRVITKSHGKTGSCAGLLACVFSLSDMCVSVIHTCLYFTVIHTFFSSVFMSLMRICAQFRKYQRRELAWEQFRETFASFEV